MSAEHVNAVVIAGYGVTPEATLPVKSIDRMDTGISVWEQGMREQDGGIDMVVTGGYSFMVDEPPIREAVAMEKYAVGKGVDPSRIHREGRSLDSVGNALFTKTDVVLPQGWDNLIVVTSRSHLPRLVGAFRHIMGPDIRVEGVSAPEQVTPKERAYEVIGGLMMREIMRSTKPGDHEAIQERLFDLIPGYDNSSPATKARLAVRSLAGRLLPR